MAKVTIVTDTCKRRTSPKCTKTFTYTRRPGRPPVACAECKATPVSKTVGARPTSGKCGCGKTFQIQARGRIALRCDDCRTTGTVWRTDDDGMVQMIQAAQISREEQERREALGSERAANLVERMKPLLEKKHRTVIMH